MICPNTYFCFANLYKKNRPETFRVRTDIAIRLKTNPLFLSAIHNTGCSGVTGVARTSLSFSLRDLSEFNCVRPAYRRIQPDIWAGPALGYSTWRLVFISFFWHVMANFFLSFTIFIEYSKALPDQFCALQQNKIWKWMFFDLIKTYLPFMRFSF